MTTPEDIRKEILSREKELKDNPLLRFGMGGLVNKMIEIYNNDPNVIKLENEIPERSQANYLEYQAIIKELDERVGRYSIKSRSKIIY